MDSMRHLSTSLPRNRRRQDPSSELLTDFKAAALSVTNLYKAAALSETKARNAGYQDALDDLLAFLDRENLGLMDGEGWRVRRWATERLTDDAAAQQVASDEEEDNSVDQLEEARSLSPEVQRKPSSIRTLSSEPVDIVPLPKSSSEPPSQPPNISTLENFTFQSEHPYPSVQDKENGNCQSMDLESPNAPATTQASSADSVRLVPRASRSRHMNHNRRGNTPAFTLNLGGGASNKRKLPYPDFFDISGFNSDSHDRKDGSGRGGKRGRYV